MDGEIVRLTKGDPNLKTSYKKFKDPIRVARFWEENGAKYLHIIDLDAALGFGDNWKIIIKIYESINIPMQIGGGIRTLEVARKILDSGIDRIILGSLAIEDVYALETLLDLYGPNRLVASLDYIGPFLAIKGWRKTTDTNITEAFQRFREMGIKFYLITSIERDGTLEGPDFQNLSKLTRNDVKVIAAGGIQSLEDLKQLKKIGTYGAVVGKALYEERFSLFEANSISED
jgi:phosphoribosylformimino-5-aminoimidazole carboxamide ribotide isomerase